MKKHRVVIAAFIAGGLFLVSLPLPYWTVIMKAPTYPERDLSMRVYPTYYEGDIREWNVVGNLVGVKVPPPIPDVAFVIVPALITLLALLSLVAGFNRGWLKTAMIAPWVVLAGLTAFTQYSLYIFGHDLAPDRPLRYVEPFTPPVIGVKKIGTMLTYHLPHVGSFVYMGAALLLVWAYWQHNNEVNREEASDAA
jgi:amino acid transporter